MQKITVVDIQHKTFKKVLNGYDRADVDRFLDEIIETLEDEAQARAALEAELSDLHERISHFKSMEESLQNTLLLAQRTADEVKASAHKEADLIRAEARVAVEKEIAKYGDKAHDARREYQVTLEAADRGKSELRGLLMTLLSLLDKPSSLIPPAVTPISDLKSLESRPSDPKSTVSKGSEPTSSVSKLSESSSSASKPSESTSSASKPSEPIVAKPVITVNGSSTVLNNV